MNPPNPGPWAGWGQIVAACITLIGVFIVQGVNAWQARQARERETAEKRRHWWDEFELKTLVELQEAIGQAFRLPIKRLAAFDPSTVTDDAASVSIYCECMTIHSRIIGLAARIGDPGLLDETWNLVRLLDEADDPTSRSTTRFIAVQPC
jgi:hypothetical protein